MPRSSKSKKKFFVKEEDGIYTVFDEFFNDIETRDEALVIAMRTLGEIYSTLIEEGRSGTLFIGNMKVVTGLQRCLDELENRWPFLLQEIKSVPRVIDGRKLQYC